MDHRVGLYKHSHDIRSRLAPIVFHFWRPRLSVSLDPHRHRLGLFMSDLELLRPELFLENLDEVFGLLLATLGFSDLVVFLCNNSVESEDLLAHLLPHHVLLLGASAEPRHQRKIILLRNCGFRFQKRDDLFEFDNFFSMVHRLRPEVFAKHDVSVDSGQLLLFVVF